MGAPFVALGGLIGSDVLKYHPRMKVTEHPFNSGEEVVVAEAIRPDVGIAHALKADKFGNVIVPKRSEYALVAQASHRAVAMTEEIVDGELTMEQALEIGGTLVPAIHIDAVVLAPHGAHPGGCSNNYPTDDVHMREYIESSKNDEAFAEYLDKYIYSLPDHEAYLTKIGL